MAHQSGRPRFKIVKYKMRGDDFVICHVDFIVDGKNFIFAQEYVGVPCSVWRRHFIDKFMEAKTNNNKGE